MTARALRRTARRIRQLAAEAALLGAELERLVAAIAPWLLELSGWGRSAPPSAGELVSRLKRAVARQPFKLLDAMAAWEARS
jgi:hypothetical protein